MNNMYKGIRYTVIAAVFLILPLSCASTPETAAPEEAVEEAVEESVAETTETVEGQTAEAGKSAEDIDASKLSAEAARQKAVDAKAPKAVPELFEEGETLYSSAKSAAEAGNTVQAVQDYLGAKEAYELSAVEADIKKQEALAAMAAADEAIANAEKAAAEALEAAEEEE